MTLIWLLELHADQLEAEQLYFIYWTEFGSYIILPGRGFWWFYGVKTDLILVSEAEDDGPDCLLLGFSIVHVWEPDEQLCEACRAVITTTVQHKHCEK